jgi:cytochrome c oxidase accessory protein FixG
MVEGEAAMCDTRHDGQGEDGKADTRGSGEAIGQAIGLDNGADDAMAVLATLNNDGSRRWLTPRLSVGTFWRLRRATAYLLIAFFTLLPFIEFNGKPLMLLDIWARRYIIMGYEFRPTDTLLLALFMIGVFLSIFFVTALLGRVWCGYACPQTVYMEFVFRPIERFFEGAPGRQSKNWFARSGAGKPIKFFVFFLVSLGLAHTFLSYFVGVERLWQWMGQSPFQHPGPFLVVVVVTGLMLFDFGFFREQLCLVACSYGRMQAVLLDRNSLIVSYDPIRGEPRGKKAGLSRDVSLRVVDQGGPAGAAIAAKDRRGDCVDCGLCVQTCPTGIDIRKGLQMECIGCAQCIDACDAVMTKLKRPKGLIRYSSQAAIAREATRLIRPRVIAYPAIVAVIAGLFVFVLSGKGPADVNVLRGMGVPHTVLESGEIANQVRVKIANRVPETRSYTIALVGEDGVALPGARLEAVENPVTLTGDESRTSTVQLVFPHAILRNGSLPVKVRIEDGLGWSRDLSYTLFGPASAPARARGAGAAEAASGSDSDRGAAEGATP